MVFIFLHPQRSTTKLGPSPPKFLSTHKTFHIMISYVHIYGGVHISQSSNHYNAPGNLLVEPDNIVINIGWVRLFPQ